MSTRPVTSLPLGALLEPTRPRKVNAGKQQAAQRELRKPMHTNPHRVRPVEIADITDLDPTYFAGDGTPRDTADPDDIIHDNTRKAGFAAAAITAYATEVGHAAHVIQPVIRDLAADLYHLADALGINLDDTIREGRDDYLAEISPDR
jgi:hypothetical protein